MCCINALHKHGPRAAKSGHACRSFVFVDHAFVLSESISFFSLLLFGFVSYLECIILTAHLCLPYVKVEFMR